MSVLLSIIIPSFEQAKLLSSALKSIEAQLFKRYEILVMDGGSTDETSATVKEFAHLPIRFCSEPDSGIYDAMNKGIEQSSGKYIYFMGCDDRLFEPTSLSRVFDDKESLKNDFIYGNVIFTSDNRKYDGRFSQLKLISRNICHQAIFVKREVFDRIGNFNLQYRYLGDWDFNMRCFSNPQIKKKYVDVIIAYYNNDGSSFNLPDTNFFADKWRLDKQYFSPFIRILNNRVYWLAKILVKYFNK